MEINTYKYKNKSVRALFFLLGDTLALVFASVVAFFILTPLASSVKPFPIWETAVLVGSILAGLGLYKMYLVNWRYTGLRELAGIILGVTAGGIVYLVVAGSLYDFGNFEYAYTALFLLNGVLFVGGFRISKRVLSELIYFPRTNKKHTIIYGGESEGEQIIRDILKNEQWNLSVYGFFDDRVMHGMRLHGVKCLGGTEEMIDYIRHTPVEQLIVAIPDMPKKDLKDVIDKVKRLRPKMNIKVLPSFHSLTEDPVGFKNIRDISFEDILGREPVNIDLNTIRESITGRTVMVTGAGGSIGSELVRQCAKLNPDQLVALDIDETELFHLQNELDETDFTIMPCVANITDEKKIEQILDRLRPDVIFHAAAYKHVPMMESFPEEAIKVNVGGTKVFAKLACEYGVEKFVMVSTDKAVNPTNVMGATKRVAEEICMSYNGTCMTRFISVRFGNVLGSRGSVVPIFIDQIENGGPITITDPEMQRYFMTIPEAVLLVMQAGAMGTGGEVFVLDMGEPVKIIDMAGDLVRLYGLEPGKDIQFEISGKRPGEKLFEELLTAEEGVEDTEHPEIHKAICSSQLGREELNVNISNLLNAINNGSIESVRHLLKEIVPTYNYQDEQNSNKKLNKNGAFETEETEDAVVLKGQAYV